MSDSIFQITKEMIDELSFKYKFIIEEFVVDWYWDKPIFTMRKDNKRYMIHKDSVNDFAIIDTYKSNTQEASKVISRKIITSISDLDEVFNKAFSDE